MILDYTRTSTGRFTVHADVRGSYGEVRSGVMVGRRHRSVHAAIAAGMQLVRGGTRGVVVRNASNGWFKVLCP